ncbi:MAG: hypothetical protein ACFFBJ_07680 [Promethearchaeota archaeon]
MSERSYQLLGRTITIFGLSILLILVVCSMIIFGYDNHQNIPPDIVISSQGIAILVGFFSVDLIVTCAGMLILKKHRKMIPFFAKSGGPIHSGKAWTKISEPDLFLTSCGIVLSINQESNTTSHVGYRIVTAKRATCSECIRREGRAIMEPVAHSGGG